MSSDQGPLDGLTCIACRLMFSTAATQRDHYKTDLHRHNLRRKIAELPPLTAEEFALRQAPKATVEAQDLHCVPCSKRFKTQNAFSSHVNSKKHHERAAAHVPYVPQEEEYVPPEPPKPLEDMTIDEIVAWKISVGVALEPTECLFCLGRGTTFDSVEECVEHMAVEHSFFIPDVDFVADVSALLQFFGKKIGIGNACLHCDKAFQSLDSVRRHMSSTNHTKLPWGAEASDELREFYDFGESEEREMPDGSVVVLRSRLGPNEREPARHLVEAAPFELRFSDGRVVGHRALASYYKQAVVASTERDAALLRAKASSAYRRISLHGEPNAAMKARMSKQEKRAVKTEQRLRYLQSVQVSRKQNKIQIVLPQVMQ